MDQYTCMNHRLKSDDVIEENFRVRGIDCSTELYQALADAAMKKDLTVSTHQLRSSEHKRTVLRYLIFQSYLIAFAQQLPKHGRRLINYPEMAMICGLHLELRIGNKLIKLLLSEAGEMCCKVRLFEILFFK